MTDLFPATAPPQRAGGFTLLELMVVLTLMGILLTFAVINIGAPAPDERLEEEAQRLQALLRLASDEAVLRSRIYGVRLRADGYTFVARQADGWQPLDTAPLQQRHLDRAISLRPPAVAADEADAAPQLWLFPDGQMTPFAVDLTSGALRRRVIGAQTGEIRIEKP